LEAGRRTTEVRKRILYIHHGKGIGGAPLSLLYLIKTLDSNRYEAVVVCLHDSAAAELYRKEGLKTIAGLGVTSFAHTTVYWYRWYEFHKIFIALWYQIKTALLIAPRLYRKSNPDIVHLNTSTLLGWGIAAKLMKIPVICHVREPLADGYLGLRRAFIKYITHWFTSAFIPICRYDGSKLIQSEKINVVYNFVNFKQFNRDLTGKDVRHDLGISMDASVILYLGGLSKIKGLLELLQSAEIFLKENDYLVIAGKMWGEEKGVRKTFLRLLNRLKINTYRKRVEAQLKKLRQSNPNSSIMMVGVRNDIPELLAISNLLVFPAVVPHFARPVIEAAAMGKPSVASALGGVVELIDDGITGLLVQSENTKQLGESILRLLSNPAECKEMGENAYQKAKNLFDDKKNSAKIFCIYDKILSGK
jgi:glycosyltransferase involved in cell wall biosynthesis